MSKKRLALLTLSSILLVTLVGTIAYLYWRPDSPEAAPTPTPTESPTTPNTGSNGAPETAPATYPGKVFFSKHPESDDNPALTFPVSRVSPDIGVGTYAIEQLIVGPTASEAAAGYFSKVAVRDDESTCDGRDFTLSIDSGVATLQFCRTFDAIGTMSDGQADQTIKATLLQFPTVTKVIVLNKEGNCQFDMSGMNLCKQ